MNPLSIQAPFVPSPEMKRFNGNLRNFGLLSANPVSAALKSDEVFQRVKNEIANNPDLAKSINGIFLYNVTENGKTTKQWTVDLKNPVVYEGAPKEGKADVTVTISDTDLLELAAGTISPQVAYLKGKLKLAGNIMLAQKLGPLMDANKPKAKL
ncbi:non-specific lipid-transfer protein-like 1 [Hyposmocoma kahamanoa]|uniref:non-specific lipid-transfer protein-like 1 n=1 Tax=Hyposmocoma kahamanoa TaxID=1477025 RepID=UPI000E6D77D9|nr:non-specific lipid-transfer protein-like 1 [Hyposmocoma kahamanoa]